MDEKHSHNHQHITPAMVYPQGDYPPPHGGQSSFYPTAGYQAQFGGYSGNPPAYGLQPGGPPPSGCPPQLGAPQGKQKFSGVQLKSLAAATLIFVSGGMSFAQSVGISTKNLDPLLREERSHMQMCWFIAVIIGACLSTLFSNKLTKRNFDMLSSVLVIVNGILFVSAPKSVAAITIARYFDGIAFGLTLIPTIIAGSEQSVPRFRGRVLTVEQIGLTGGFMLETIYCNFWGYEWSMLPNQMHGVLAIICGTLAIFIAPVYTIESPVFYLRRNNEADALNTIRHLQGSHTDTNAINALLYEHKQLLQEDDARGRSENVSASLMPMVKVCLFRVLVALSFTFALTWGFMIVSLYDNRQWAPYMYAGARLMGVVISIFTLDTLGRRVLNSFALLVGGGLLMVIAGVCQLDYFDLMRYHMITIITLALIYQLFAGHVASASTCYLGEAFSVSMKPYFILLTVILENVIQIIVYYSFGRTFDSMTVYGYTVGVLQIVLAIGFYILMPETKQTTLRQALAKFNEAAK